MSKIALKSVVWKEEKAYVALSLNTGVSSFGDTKKEALASLQEALSLYFELLQSGLAEDEFRGK